MIGAEVIVMKKFLCINISVILLFLFALSGCSENIEIAEDNIYNFINYQNEEDIIYYYAINNNPPELNGIFSMYVDSSGGSLYLQNRSDNCLYISDTEGLDIVLGVNLNA